MYTCIGYISKTCMYQYYYCCTTTVPTTSCEQFKVCGLDMYDHYQRYTHVSVAVVAVVAVVRLFRISKMCRCVGPHRVHKQCACVRFVTKIHTSTHVYEYSSSSSITCITSTVATLRGQCAERSQLLAVRLISIL